MSTKIGPYLNKYDILLQQKHNMLHRNALMSCCRSTDETVMVLFQKTLHVMFKDLLKKQHFTGTSAYHMLCHIGDSLIKHVRVTSPVSKWLHLRKSEKGFAVRVQI